MQISHAFPEVLISASNLLACGYAHPLKIFKRVDIMCFNISELKIWGYLYQMCLFRHSAQARENFSCFWQTLQPRNHLPINYSQLYSGQSSQRKIPRKLFRILSLSNSLILFRAENTQCIQGETK